MSEVMARLREEHKNIEKILKALEHQLAIFGAAERPDYDVLEAIAEYFAGFSDRCHHPIEDLIHRKLRHRAPAAAESLMDLEAEHAKVSALAGHFREAVQNVLLEIEVPRGAFDKVARHFIGEQRDHMRKEEERFFPLALEVLTPEDWTEIDARITQEEDPVFGNDVAQEFTVLRDAVLKWEQEDKGLGR
jgi:hemerythrin-like domain-containing protein